MRVNLAALTIALTGFAAGTVLAENYCDVPMVNWRPQIELLEILSAKGWAVERIKFDDGCYEAKALDQQGRHIEVLFNPVTFEIEKLEFED